jgi:hypothetical protein
MPSGNSFRSSAAGYRQVTHNESFFYFLAKGGMHGLTKGPGPDETMQ